MMEISASVVVGSIFAMAMFIWALERLLSHLSPSDCLVFPEYTSEELGRSDTFAAIESYLSKKAPLIRGELGKDSASQVFRDTLEGARLTWSFFIQRPDHPPPYGPVPDIRREYRLSFHHAHHRLVVARYLPLVIAEGKAITLRQHPRRIFTNISRAIWDNGRRTLWRHVPFDHPATFDTLAMDPIKKSGIVEGLTAFTRGEEFYKGLGKPWMREYLLYGPPGTGKSTMIAAMANLLGYDIYYLVLTDVKSNNALRKLMMEITPKSVTVIEDIDRALDLFDRSEERKEEQNKADGEEEDSKVTLSGLFNVVDGLWSSCSGERLVVFTTNHIHKLDPRLIRRIDFRVGLSYCCFEGFKVLARNYLALDHHFFFHPIKQAISEVDITPADIAKELMPKSGETSEFKLHNLLRFLREYIHTSRQSSSYITCSGFSGNTNTPAGRACRNSNSSNGVI